MRRFLILCAALLLGGMSTVQAPPDQFAQLMMMGVGGASGGGSAFVGPLDGQSTPVVAVSLRRLLSSYVANKAIHVTCSGGTSSSGDVGFTAAGDFDTTGYNAHLGTGTCNVDTWYDQSGNGNNVVQATAANQPQITLNAANGKAGIAWNNTAPTFMQTTATFTFTQPFTFNFVGLGGTAAFQNGAGIVDATNTPFLGMGSSNTVAGMSAISGSSFNSSNTITAGTLMAVNGTFNAASSAILFNGTSTVGNPGTMAAETSKPFGTGYDGNSANVWNNTLFEVIYWTGTVTPTTFQSNQQSYY